MSLPYRPGMHHVPSFFTFKAGVGLESYMATLDYIFFTDGPLRLRTLRHPLTGAQEDALRTSGGLPNAWNPSDHLPVAAVFDWPDSAAEGTGSVLQGSADQVHVT